MGTSSQLQALSRRLRRTACPAQPCLHSSGGVLQHQPAQLCLGPASGCLTVLAALFSAQGCYVPAPTLTGLAGGSCCAPAQRARPATAQRAFCARLSGAAVRRCPVAGAHIEDCKQDGMWFISFLSQCSNLQILCAAWPCVIRSKALVEW